MSKGGPFSARYTEGIQPTRIAREIQDTTYDIWTKEWERADLARELVNATTPDEFRHICHTILETSHRNVARWARKAERWPPDTRSPEYSYRSHDELMLRAREGLDEAR